MRTGLAWGLNHIATAAWLRFILRFQFHDLPIIVVAVVYGQEHVNWKTANCREVILNSHLDPIADLIDHVCLGASAAARDYLAAGAIIPGQPLQ